MPHVQREGQQRIVPERSVGRYLAEGWTGGTSEAPAQSAPKSDWVDYADSLGVDVSGMTKAEIVEAVG